MSAPPKLCCPACRGEIVDHPNSYECAACERHFPIIAGIPDFRLRSDRYLSLEEERAKAEVLHKAAETKTFAQLLDYYYQITDDVSSANAARFADYALDGPRRAGLAIEDFGSLAPDARLIDLGCGSAGGLLAGRDQFSSVVGLDIAMRWLVIGRKRLEENGLNAMLVCADLASPPFADGQFSHALALDVIEHAYEVEPALLAIRHQLQSGGQLWLSANNKRWPGPHPSAGIWAAGYRSPGSRSVGRGLASYDPLRFVALLTPGSVYRACEKAGLTVLDICPNRILGRQRKGGVAFFESVYARMRQVKLLRRLLVLIGPFFQLTARAP